MKLDQLMTLVGKEGLLMVSFDLWVPVRILRVISSYGTDLVLIEAITGRGTKWVNLKSIELRNNNGPTEQEMNNDGTTNEN